LDPVKNTSGNMFEQMGTLVHLLFYKAVNQFVVQSICKLIALHRRVAIGFNGYVYFETVAYNTLTPEIAMVGIKFHSFQFYQSHIYSIKDAN